MAPAQTLTCACAASASLFQAFCFLFFIFVIFYIIFLLVGGVRPTYHALMAVVAPLEILDALFLSCAVRRRSGTAEEADSISRRMKGEGERRRRRGRTSGEGNADHHSEKR